MKLATQVLMLAATAGLAALALTPRKPATDDDKKAESHPPAYAAADADADAWFV